MENDKNKQNKNLEFASSELKNDPNVVNAANKKEPTNEELINFLESLEFIGTLYAARDNLSGSEIQGLLNKKEEKKAKGEKTNLLEDTRALLKQKRQDKANEQNKNTNGKEL